MIITQKAGPLCDNAPSTGNIFSIVRLIRESHPHEAVRKSRRKPSYSSELEGSSSYALNLRLNPPGSCSMLTPAAMRHIRSISVKRPPSVGSIGGTKCSRARRPRQGTPSNCRPVMHNYRL